MPAYQESVLKLCGLHVKARDFDAAWQDRAAFVKSGGTLLPVALWFELCRAAECPEDFELAVQEYGELLAAYTKQRLALLALINFSRICLSKLTRPPDALALYDASAR